MKYNHIKWIGSLLIFAFLNMSCAGTKIERTYVDETYTGKVSNFFVIALIGSPLHQRNFEDEFVSQLKSIGVDAVSSAEVMSLPEDLILTKEMILKAVQKNNNDAVIISQIAGFENDDVYRRGLDGSHYFDYYSAGYRLLHNSGSKNSNTTTIQLETRLFDVKTEKLIWAGITETLGRDPETGEIQTDAIKTMVEQLRNSPLISH